MNFERCKEIMEKVGPMSPYSDVSIPAVELFELCQDAMKWYELEIVEGRRDDIGERLK